MPRSPRKLFPFAIAILFFLLDVPIGAAHVLDGENTNSAVVIGEESPSIPAFLCGVEECLKDRNLDYTSLDSSPPAMEFGWWHGFWSDSDSNGFDDRLQLIVAGERESVSVTSIIGDDGRGTVAIIVHYAWHPGDSDIDSLRGIIGQHGWEEEESWFMVMDHLDAIVLDHVPVSSLVDIWSLEGVVLVEEQSVIVPYLNKATKSSKVRESGIYDETLRGLGYHGSGKVIAILDTGVDNEHFSLDDFSDNNKDNTKDPDDIEDPKWVGGCDATGVGQSGCNDEDPDDGDGHGTHVAGIALGTGDSSRLNQGYSPGSYLVDVKVMEDYGGGNSQSILAGIQWTINNRDTDWGNNVSSRGIHVLSMSFGRASSAVGDNNEDGSSAEGNLVDQASESGLVCVAAIGNDGANNVNSVGAADTSITVGWLDDKNNIDRSDDSISSNSNYGPRTDDEDGDSWDEMKPWVVAPGSNINSAEHAESSGIIPGSEVNRASDDYTQLSGSSMSTPAVAGLVAIMLEIGEMRKMPFMDEDSPGIERYEAIRSFLASGSEFRNEWSVDETWQDNNWNTRYGFGIIDGGEIASEMFGGGGVTNDTGGPQTPQEGHWVDIESPAAYSWLVEGESYNLRGHINEHGENNGTIEEVVAKVEMKFKKSPNTPKEKLILVNWTRTIGITNWTIPFAVPDLPDEYSEVSITGMVAARNNIGRWSNTTNLFSPVGIVNITLEVPSGLVNLEGSVEVFGEFQSIGNATIQWRIDYEDWQDATHYHDGRWSEDDRGGLKHSSSNRKGDGSSDPGFQGHAYCAHMFRESKSTHSPDEWVVSCEDDDRGWTSWSFDWDTTQYKDDEYRLSVRIVSAVGVFSEELRRVIQIDNVEPMPDLLFVSKSISVQEFGIPMQESYVNTFLEVRATIRNTGDQAATNVGVILEEWGERRDEYVIANIDSGQFVEVVLYWNPMNAGDSLLSISIDPLNSIQELDDNNNDLSGTFSVAPRPPGVDLAIRAGSISAVTVSSPIPRPDESAVVQARIDNLGSQDAVGVSGTLEMMTERGWEMIENSTIPLVLGGSHSMISFPFTPNISGPIEVRVSVLLESGGDNDWSNNVRVKTLLVDSTTLSGPREADLNPGESPVAIVSLDSEEGDDLLIGEKDGTLLMYKLTESRSLIGCNNVIEERWAGDIAIIGTDEGFAHIVWTRRYMGPNWFLMQTLSYSTIDSSCRIAPVQDLLPGIPLSDGKYWGVDMDVRDSEILVSGYHRDVFSEGSFEDETSIFLLHSENPLSSEDWTLESGIIRDINADPAQRDPLSVEFGHEQAHILYQTIRNDTTGRDRLGVWYSHGQIGQENWAYRKAVGDETSLPMLTVIEDDDGDTLISLWREGDPQDSELVVFVTDSNFRTNEGMETRIPARGMAGIGVVESDRGIQVLFDRVGAGGPQVEYGLIDVEEGWIGLSDTLVRGQYKSMDRSEDSGETMMVISSSNGWQIRTLIDDESSRGGGSLSDQLRSSLGLDQESFEILVIGVALAVLILGMVTLVGLSAQGVRWVGRKGSIDKEASVVMEDDVVDLVDETDFSIGSDDVEIVDEAPEGVEESGRKSRRARRDSRNSADALVSDSTDPVTNAELEIPTPNAPIVNPVGGQVPCFGCGSRFVTEPGVISTKCPVCGSIIEL
jgi:subtilisin family serine protease